MVGSRLLQLMKKKTSAKHMIPLKTIRELRELEDRAEQAVAQRCKASVIATCLAKARIRVRLTDFNIHFFIVILILVV